MDSLIASLNRLAHEEPFAWGAALEALEGMRELLEWAGAAEQARKLALIGQFALRGEREAPPLDPEVMLAQRHDVALTRLAALPRNVIPEPAPLPAGSSVPFAPNPHFVGRAAILHALGVALKDGQAAAIVGPAGYGKTQLAAEIAHRYGPYFLGGVHWLSCAEPEAIPAAIAACGSAMGGLHEAYGQLPLDERVRLAITAWEGPAPRLIIFDNCEDPGLVARWRPRSTASRVLVTSRQRQWPSALGVAVHQLELLDHGASIALLRRHRPDLAANDSDLDTLAELLGGLPLALHLAGSYLERHRETEPVAAYLSRLRATDVLWHGSLAGASLYSPTSYSLPVARTLAVSLQQLDPVDPVEALARALLARAAHFAPGVAIDALFLYSTVDNVFLAPIMARLTVFARFERALGRLLDLGLLGRVTDARPFVGILREARVTVHELEAGADSSDEVGSDRLLGLRNSLALMSRGAVRIHRLVAAFARERADDLSAHAAVIDQLLAWGEICVEIGAPETLSDQEAHLRHVTLAALQSGHERAAQLGELTGHLLLSLGQASTALSYLERAAGRYREQRGDQSLALAGCLACLADAYAGAGDLDHAWDAAQEAYEIRSEVLGTDASAAGESLCQLGTLLHRRGELEAALTMLKQALAIQEQHDVFLTARVYARIGALLLTLQEWSRAAGCYDRALDLSAKIFGDDHYPAEEASMRHGLGIALRELGRYLEAREQLEVALQIRTGMSLNHPDAIGTLLELARLGLAASWWEGARAWLAQADTCMRISGSAEHLYAANYGTLMEALQAQAGHQPEPTSRRSKRRRGRR